MNRKGYFLLCIVMLVFLSLTGCKKEHTHSWNDGEIIEAATCAKEGTKKYTCTECEETRSEAINYVEHNYTSASCEAPKTCIECGKTEGESLEHTWQDANCDAPKTCTLCGETDGTDLGHIWEEATFDTPKTCTLCGETEGLDLFFEAISESVPTETNTKITFPTTILGYNATWKSLDKGVMLDDGTVVYNDTQRQALLKVEMDIDGEIVTRELTVNVNPASINVAEYKYIYNIYAAIFDRALHADVTLLTRKQQGFSPIYESLDESVITSEGVITKTTVVQSAIMNIYIVKNGVAALYPTEVTVSDYSSLERIDLAIEEIQGLAEQLEKGEIDTLPFYSETYDVKLSWLSDVPSLVVLEDRILLPIEKTNVHLKCTLSRETVISPEETEVESKSIKFRLEGIGGTSVDEYLNQWLKTILPTEIIGHKNIVYDQYGTGELFLKSQYAVNTGAVLNLIDGKTLTINKDYYVDVKNETGLVSHWSSTYHPAISTDPTSENLQAVYEHFYEGYTIPNDENILWIVVHESGMPKVGDNAKLLAEIQYDRAHGNRAKTEASWHYQVDETGIYQTFDDTVYAWHAGGDCGKWLPYRNQNSIGIEMCINQDGNYDGSMAHDAKLVAQLMHKYNLTMDNVVRHHDTSGKECPSYMIRTNRYEEFLQKVCQEYVAMEYLKDAEVTWTISNPDLFIKGPNGLYYSKAVSTPTEVTLTLKVVKGSYTFNQSVTLTLKPDGAVSA